MAEISPSLSVITLNVNGLDLVKSRDWQNGFIYIYICSKTRL